MVDLLDGRMPFSVNHYLCPADLPLVGFMDELVRHGFKGIGLTRRALAEMSVDRIRAELDARGLVVSSINSAGYFLEDGRVSSAALHENENLLRAAERLGGVVNVIVGGCGNQSLDAVRARTKACLHDFARLAGDAGVALVLEPLSPLNVMGRSCLNTIAQAMDWMEGARNLALTVDVLHAWWDPGLPCLLSESDAPVGLYQVCDVAVDDRTGMFRRAPFGEGHIDGLADIATVRRIHPGVWIELELFADQMPDRQPLDVLQHCAKSLQSIERGTS